MDVVVIQVVLVELLSNLHAALNHIRRVKLALVEFKLKSSCTNSLDVYSEGNVKQTSSVSLPSTRRILVNQACKSRFRIYYYLSLSLIFIPFFSYNYRRYRHLFLARPDLS